MFSGGTFPMPTLFSDLALEAREALLSATPGEIDGVLFEEHRQGVFNTLISTVRVLNETGERTVGKPAGTYITLESPYLSQNHLAAHEEITELLSQTLQSLLPLREEASVLIIGLGNRNVAADSLGPLTVSGLLVSRHIREAAPEELRDELRSVCALAPGVMGQTGIETLEIVCGIQDRIHADAILLIDALAARSISRVNTTIQLTDTGIRPGAGIGNRRQMLSSKNLGAPVVALGIPTVVDARTMILDAVPDASPDLLEGYSNLYVTPKNMDFAAAQLSGILSGALNRYLHRLSAEALRQYLY